MFSPRRKRSLSLSQRFQQSLLHLRPHHPRRARTRSTVSTPTAPYWMESRSILWANSWTLPPWMQPSWTLNLRHPKPPVITALINGVLTGAGSPWKHLNWMKCFQKSAWSFLKFEWHYFNDKSRSDKIVCFLDKEIPKVSHSYRRAQKTLQVTHFESWKLVFSFVTFL